jgi:carbon starvation protein
VEEETLISRTGGAPTLAFGMSSIFSSAWGSGLAAFWYHFAIMFEALFILTAVDAGTRVGRFMLQDTIGNAWPKYAQISWKPASWSASAIVVGLWGYMLYVGVTDPLGGINQLFPLFGIANQLLAAIALTLATTLLIKHGKAKWAWVPGVGLVWDLIVTLTASYQKVFSDNPKIGYWQQRADFKAAMDSGEVVAPATDMDQMQQIVTNSTVNGTLQALFALLVIVIVLNALFIWVKAIRAGGLPTTEVPKVPSKLVAPSDFFATKEEKAAVREWEESQGRLVGGPR